MTRIVVVDIPGQRGYMPIAGALLISTARNDPEIAARMTFDLLCVDASEPPKTIVERIMADGSPALVAFSIQGWALPLADSIARRLSETTECLIVYGGNHVTSQAEKLAAERPFLDAVANGEGEGIFLDLMRALLALPASPDLASVPGLSARTAENTFTRGDVRPRIVDLNDIPSPYLTGLINPAEHKFRIALLETNRGCPYKCSFCYWGAAVNSKLRQFSLERVYAEMEILARNGVESWYICDANFGILKRDLDIVEHILRLREDYGVPHTVHTNWAKNSNERVVSIVSRLAAGGVHSTFTLALQSTDAFTLELAQRSNMAVNNVKELARLCRASGVVPRGELIWGLPGESYDRFKRSYDDLAEHVDAISVYPHYILPNTEYDARRADLKIVTEKSELDTDYEYCVEHLSMTRADFLTGMRFIISNNILRTGSNFLAVYSRVASRVAGIRPSRVIEAFAEWITTTGTPVPDELGHLFRFPLAMHRLSFGGIRNVIKKDRDGFLAMLEAFFEECFHHGMPPGQARILRSALSYDQLIFPQMENRRPGPGPEPVTRTEAVFDYDFLALHRGGDWSRKKGRYRYRVQHRTGLPDYSDEEWYFGLLGFRGKVDYLDLRPDKDHYQ